MIGNSASALSGRFRRARAALGDERDQGAEQRRAGRASAARGTACSRRRRSARRRPGSRGPRSARCRSARRARRARTGRLRRRRRRPARAITGKATKSSSSALHTTIALAVKTSPRTQPRRATPAPSSISAASKRQRAAEADAGLAAGHAPKALASEAKAQPVAPIAKPLASRPDEARSANRRRAAGLARGASTRASRPARPTRPIGAVHSHGRPCSAAWTMPLAGLRPAPRRRAGPAARSCRRGSTTAGARTRRRRARARRSTARPSCALAARICGASSTARYGFSAGSQCSAILPFSRRNMSNQVVLYFFVASFGSTYFAREARARRSRPRRRSPPAAP